MKFADEKNIIKNKIENIIRNNDMSIINPFHNNTHKEIKSLTETYGISIVSKIIDEEVKKYDCYKEPTPKPPECYGIVGEDTVIGKHGAQKQFLSRIGRIYDPLYRKMKTVLNKQENKENEIAAQRAEPIILSLPKRRKKTVKRSDSPDTITSDIYTPANFERGGRKKTRRRRKKKSKRKKTRRRRKKKKTRRKKKKSKRKKSKRKKSKRKKRSRKLRGGNYWKFNDKSKKYECYMTVNHEGSKKHLLGKIATFDSLPEFTKHMCKWYIKNKHIPGLIQHPKILNKDDPKLKIIKDRTKGADNSGINIYQYSCGFCRKIITYNDRREKSIHFNDWDFEKLPSKKEQNYDKFNKYIKKQLEQEQSINDGRERSGSAHNFEYREVSPSAYKQDEYYEYDPYDNNW